MNNIPDLTLTGNIKNYAISVSGAGDVNGDGYSDVIVGATDYYGIIDTGTAYIYFGGHTPNNIADVIFTGNGYFGISVSGAGDVNGDGYSDVIISDHTYDNGEINEGKAFLYHGSVSGLSSSPNWTFEGNLANAYFGWGASAAPSMGGR